MDAITNSGINEAIADILKHCFTPGADQRKMFQRIKLLVKKAYDQGKVDEGRKISTRIEYP